MQPSDFLQQLARRGLSLQISDVEGQTKLRLLGDMTRVTDRIRLYISNNRQGLIDHLLRANRDTSEQRYVPCYLSEYGLCSNLVIEQDDSTWRMSPDGLVFCLECWQSRNIAQAKRAHPYLADHDQPTDLGTRIERIMSGPGYSCCGGHDWRIDYDGILVCHHVIEGRETIEREKQEARSLPVGKKAKASAA